MQLSYEHIITVLLIKVWQKNVHVCDIVTLD